MHNRFSETEVIRTLNAIWVVIMSEAIVGVAFAKAFGYKYKWDEKKDGAIAKQIDLSKPLGCLNCNGITCLESLLKEVPQESQTAKSLRWWIFYNQHREFSWKSRLVIFSIHEGGLKDGNTAKIVKALKGLKTVP